MDRIVCLVGESGSGKSTIAEKLEELGYNYIQSYTTRSPRHPEEKGHIFVDTLPRDITTTKTGPTKLTTLGPNIIAHTFFDNHHYWATKEQFQGKGISVYVIDPPGVKKLKEKLWKEDFEGEVDILVIYLKIDERSRYQRLVLRNGQRKATERMIHDLAKFKVIDCNYVIDAKGPIETVLDRILGVIR